jgi:hypothetical protein
VASAASTRRRASPVYAAAAALGVALLVVGGWISRAGPRVPGDWWGLAAGGAATALIALDLLYAGRRRLAARPFGTAAIALRVHVAAGVLTIGFVLFHAGLRLPAGWLGRLLDLSLLTSVLTGALGLALERAVPPRLARLEGAATAEPATNAAARALADEGARAAEGATERLAAAYRRDFAPLLSQPVRVWRHLVRPAGQRELTAERVRHVSLFLPVEDRARAETLARVLADRFDLDARAAGQWLVRAWLTVHVPASTLLVALLMWHLYAVWAW